MKDITIYLAGAMVNCKSFEEMNAWREYVSRNIERSVSYCDWEHLEIINPCYYYNFEDPRNQTEREVMQFDLAKLKGSDLVIVNLDGLNTSIGTAIELYEAYKQDIPVIAYDPSKVYEYTHSWLKCCITRVEKDINSLIDYLTDFYFR